MRDTDVRKRLKAELWSDHGSWDTLILDELTLVQGAARLDIALINGAFRGYEIKSDHDRLDRLPRQLSVYNGVLDEVVLVSAERHLERARDLVPDWWGLAVATMRAGEVAIEQLRLPESNPGLTTIGLAQILWREELLGALSQVGSTAGSSRRTRAELATKVADQFDLATLRSFVRFCLRTRPRALGHNQRDVVVGPVLSPLHGVAGRPASGAD